MGSPLKKVRARRGAATFGRFETAPRLVRRATRSRSDSPRVHRRDLGFDEYGAQTRTLSARPKVTRRRSARPLQDGYARRRPAPLRPRGAKGLRPADHMNPIEKAYSKLKAFLRKIAERTIAGLLIALDACADIFKPAECVNYFNACGYDTG